MSAKRGRDKVKYKQKWTRGSEGLNERGRLTLASRPLIDKS